MGKDHQSKKVESAPKAQPVKPAVEPAGMEMDSLPGKLITGGVHDLPHDLPPSIQRKQILHRQKIAGNRYVLRSLQGGVVQRRWVQRQGGPMGGGSPIPTLPDLEARNAFALDILKKAYGGRIKQESQVEGKPDVGALRTAYDEAMISQEKKYHDLTKKDTDEEWQDWKSGDATRHPDTSTDAFKGFHDPKSGKILIDTSKPPDDQVATLVHEGLHANASADFGETLGKPLEEGMTEKLARSAIAKAGYAAPTGTYDTEVGFMENIAQMVGSGNLEAAYFGGVGILKEVLNAGADKDIFDDFAREAKARNWSWMSGFFNLYYEKLKSGSELEKKTAAINMYLDGWVSDEDIGAIESIFATASEEEKVQLRSVIYSRIGDLWDLGQRARLRVMLG